MTGNTSVLEPPEKRPKKGKVNYLKPIVIFALFILLAMCIYVIIHLPDMLKDTGHNRAPNGIEQKEKVGEHVDTLSAPDKSTVKIKCMERIQGAKIL